MLTPTSLQVQREALSHFPDLMIIGPYSDPVEVWSPWSRGKTLESQALAGGTQQKSCTDFQGGLRPSTGSDM